MEFKINKIETDEFGRPNGILLVNKPKWRTSHDIVDETRKRYQTRKVGHAGTLDPFAEGLLIILIGRATKLSNSFLGLDKSYTANVLFGISTWSGDVEGEIKDFFHQDVELEEEELRQTFRLFQPGYEQYVPLYSSVKVEGRKLRVLARKYPKKQLIEIGDQKKYLFKDESNKPIDEVTIPKKYVSIKQMKLIGKLERFQINTDKDLFTSEDLHKAVISDSGEYFVNPSINKYATENGGIKYFTATIEISCSKGTYIRQLAEDLGSRVGNGIPSMLTELRRTSIGSYKLRDAIDL